MRPATASDEVPPPVGGSAPPPRTATRRSRRRTGRAPGRIGANSQLRRRDHGRIPFACTTVPSVDIGQVIGRDVRDDGLRRRVDAVGQELREHAEHEQQGQDRGQHEHLAEAHVGKQRMLLVDRAVRHPLVGPEQVDGGEDDRDRREGAEPPIHGERPQDHQELADEVVEPRQADRGDDREQEGPGEPRHDDGEAAHLAEVTRVRSLVDHPDQQEQRAGRQSVVDHLQDAARHALVVNAKMPEDDEPQVRDGGVRDQAFDVRLDQRHHGAVDDPDHRQDRDGRREVLRRLGEQLEVEADQTRTRRPSAARPPAGPSPPSALRCAHRGATCGAGTAAP